MRSDFETQHKSVASINLTEFYSNTAPEYYLFHCTMETIDCTFSWKQIRTSRGTCLSLNVNEVYNKSLKFVHQQKYKKLSQESSRSGTDLSFARNFKDTVYDILERFEKFPARDEIKELSFVVGFNKSDNTLGWNGFNNALQLYYSDVHEKFESHEDSISVRVLTSYAFSHFFVYKMSLSTEDRSFKNPIKSFATAKPDYKIYKTNNKTPWQTVYRLF